MSDGLLRSLDSTAFLDLIFWSAINNDVAVCELRCVSGLLAPLGTTFGAISLILFLGIRVPRASVPRGNKFQEVAKT